MFDTHADNGAVAGLKQRAHDRRIGQRLSPQGPLLSGVLPDPNWDAWFQAVEESAGGKNVRMVGGAPPSTPQDQWTSQALDDPYGGNNPGDRLHASQQIRGLGPEPYSPLARSTPSLQGLQSYTKRSRF